jgi:hypothetical protein
MEMRNVPLRGIKVDSLAHELATSEGWNSQLTCCHRNQFFYRRRVIARAEAAPDRHPSERTGARNACNGDR